jgi:DNA-binding transcriptional ArsR family regulator
MLDVDVIEDPAVAEVALAPMRTRLLAELVTPASASMLAARVGLPRQKVNYHLHALEQCGLVTLVEERPKGNMTERLYQASAASYVISPAALPALAPDPELRRDHLSAAWLLAVGARLVRDIGQLILGARRANKRLATFAIDSEVRFADAQSRARFAAELAELMAELVRRYHDESATGGRRHRVVVALHPSVKTESAAALES